MEQTLTDITLMRYAHKLTAEEKSPDTIKKSLRDLRRLQKFAAERQTECLTKDDFISCKGKSRIVVHT